MPWASYFLLSFFKFFFLFLLLCVCGCGRDRLYCRSLPDSAARLIPTPTLNPTASGKADYNVLPICKQSSQQHRSSSVPRGVLKKSGVGGVWITWWECWLGATFTPSSTYYLCKVVIICQFLSLVYFLFFIYAFKQYFHPFNYFLRSCDLIQSHPLKKKIPKIFSRWSF